MTGPRQSVCVEHRCVDLCPRAYDVMVMSGQIYPRDAASGGIYWDHEYAVDVGGVFECSAADCDPDPYVVLTVGGQAFQTSTIQNTTSPFWGETFEIASLDCQASYSIQIWDDDSAEDGEDDLILTFGEEGFFFFTPWDLRVGGLTVAAGSGVESTMVRLALSPR